MLAKFRSVNQQLLNTAIFTTVHWFPHHDRQYIYTSKSRISAHFVDGCLLTGFTICRSYVLIYMQMSHVLLHVDVTFYYMSTDFTWLTAYTLSECLNPPFCTLTTHSWLFTVYQILHILLDIQMCHTTSNLGRAQPNTQKKINNAHAIMMDI